MIKLFGVHLTTDRFFHYKEITKVNLIDLFFKIAPNWASIQFHRLVFVENRPLCPYDPITWTKFHCLGLIICVSIFSQTEKQTNARRLTFAPSLHNYSKVSSKSSNFSHHLLLTVFPGSRKAQIS